MLDRPAVLAAPAPAEGGPGGPAVRDHGAARAERLQARTAHAGLLALLVLTMLVRPFADATGLPAGVVNLDAPLAVVVAAVVLLLCVRGWRALDARSRASTAAVGVLALLVLVSWASGSPRSVASLGLGYASVLLLPLAALLAVRGSRVPGRPLWDLLALRLLVLLQLVVGCYQYVSRDVATHAPFYADLVDGTTSHNFWPAFALPAAVLIAALDRGAARWAWPVSVFVLAVYAEAKTALLLWAPLLAVLLVVELVLAARRAARSRPGRDGALDAGARVLAVLALGAVLAGGLWWSPSVQGTWQVLTGHTRALEDLAAGATPTTGPPTLGVARERVVDEVLGSPRSALLGLGPGNSVSHAAEVLAQGTSGITLPAPGQVALDLVAVEGDLQFEDAQSSLLGAWGDLGGLGALAYVVALLLLAREAAPRRLRLDRGTGLYAVAVVVLGAPLGAGLLLDWPEQASIVLPLAATAMVALRAARAGSADPSTGSGRGSGGPAPL